jgi:hypothetical protein
VLCWSNCWCIYVNVLIKFMETAIIRISAPKRNGNREDHMKTYLSENLGNARGWMNCMVGLLANLSFGNNWISLPTVGN